MGMIIKHVDVYEDPAGWTWKITESGDDVEPRVVARGPSFKTKPEALKFLFGLFFGDYDESFLTLYAEFNPDGQFVETEDVGEPVGVQAAYGQPVTDAVEDSHTPSRDLGA